jgi:hypothetical protein
MSRWSRDPRRREKLDLLRQLETETKERIRVALAREGETAIEGRAAKALGRVALVLLPLPWRWKMRLLAAILTRTTAAFERFERAFSDHDPALARYLAAHERAQLEFFRREAAGDAGSIEPVKALLS